MKFADKLPVNTEILIRRSCDETLTLYPVRVGGYSKNGNAVYLAHAGAFTLTGWISIEAADEIMEIVDELS